MPGICTETLKGPLLPLRFAGQVSVVAGGRGGVYDGKDERPAPLRGLSPLSLMLPLNHTDTPPVSFCEAAPVPHVSLWGKEQTSQNITGRRHSESSRGGKEETFQGAQSSAGTSWKGGSGNRERGPRNPPTLLPSHPWMDSIHRFEAAQQESKSPAEVRVRVQSNSSAHQRTGTSGPAEPHTEQKGYDLSFSFEKV